METEAEKDLQCHAPIRLDLPPEKPLSSLAKQEGWNTSELSVLNEDVEIVARASVWASTPKSEFKRL